MKANLPEKSNLFSLPAIILLVFLLLYPGGADVSGENPCNTYTLEDGIIRESAPCESRAVYVDGKVTSLHVGREGFYYLKSRGDDLYPCCVGYRKPLEGFSFEAQLPVNIGDDLVKKFMGARGIVFMLTCRRRGDDPCTLHRVELNTMKASRVERVKDFTVLGESVVLLEHADDGFAVNNNGVVIPVTIAGDLRLENPHDGRLLTVTNGSETEVLDLVLKKNIYAYTKDGSLQRPGEHNLIVEARDAGGRPTELPVMYKLFVNGDYAGRTSSGPAHQVLRYSLKLVEDEYHLIRLERWELHRARGKYLRVNNIHQPQPLRVFMPTGRFLKLTMTRDNGKYHSRCDLVKERRK